MAKRNPIANSLAKPQYRQRVVDRRQLRDKIGEAFSESLAYLEDDATPSSGCVFYDLAIACRSTECELCASRQATREEALRRMAELDEELGLYDDEPQLEGWQEPLRQMEG